MKCTRCGSENIMYTFYSICVAATLWMWKGADTNKVTYDDYEIWPISLCNPCVQSAFTDYLKFVRKKLIILWIAVIVGYILIVGSIFLGIKLWLSALYSDIDTIPLENKVIISSCIVVVVVLVRGLLSIGIRNIKQNTKHYHKERSKMRNGKTLSEMDVDTIKEACHAESMAIIKNKNRGSLLESHAHYTFPTFREYEELPEDVRRVFANGKPSSSIKVWEIAAVAESVEKLHEALLNTQQGVLEALLIQGFTWPEEFEAKWQEKIAGMRHP